MVSFSSQHRRKQPMLGYPALPVYGTIAPA
jgi:hypothetical protein